MGHRPMLHMRISRQGEKNNFRLENNFLIIVESPSKVRLIEKYLGPDYKVIASNVKSKPHHLVFFTVLG
jgi:reverse gyrase